MIGTLVLLVGASLATALYLVISRRMYVPDLRLDPAELPPIPESLPQIAGLAGGSIHEGNQAKVYQNGQLLQAMMEAISQAKHSVHFEDFVWSHGEVEKRFVALLCQKAQEGVHIRLLIDAVGARKASQHQFAKLRGCGVQLAIYHPINRFSLRRFNNRAHRKLLILDGTLAFTFGHGIADTWLGNAQDETHWRDTGVQLRGPLVNQLQIIFCQDWIDARQKPPVELSCFPKSGQAGEVIGHVVSSSGRNEHSAVALLYELAIATARQEVIIQNPYFVPQRRLVDLLGKTVARGASVHLMVPGQHTDSQFLRRAGQRLYDQLLSSGVRLYIYQPTLLHQKIVIVDGIWSHIGSTNFDARSLALNSEVGVGLVSQPIAAELKTAFEEDLQHCHQIDLAQWRARPWHQRWLDWCAYQVHSQI